MPVVLVDTAKDLDDKVWFYIHSGYELQNKTTGSAALLKHKHFNSGLATICLVLGILVLPLLILLLYCLVYLAMSDQLVEIRVRISGYTSSVAS